MVVKVSIQKAVGDKEKFVEDFEYAPEKTIENVRECAAEKLGMKSTNLQVRKQGKTNWLKIFGDESASGIKYQMTLKDHEIADNALLHVRIAIKDAENGKKNVIEESHDENLVYHEATHEKIGDLRAEIKENKSLDKKEGEPINSYKKRMRDIRTEINARIENVNEEGKAKKQKQAIEHQKALSDAANQASASLYDVAACSTVAEIEEEETKLKESYKERQKILGMFKKELKKIEKDDPKQCEFCGKKIVKSCRCKKSQEARKNKEEEERLLGIFDEAVAPNSGAGGSHPAATEDQVVAPNSSGAGGSHPAATEDQAEQATEDKAEEKEQKKKDKKEKKERKKEKKERKKKEDEAEDDKTEEVAAVTPYEKALRDLNELLVLPGESCCSWEIHVKSKSDFAYEVGSKVVFLNRFQDEFGDLEGKVPEWFHKENQNDSIHVFETSY